MTGRDPFLVRVTGIVLSIGHHCICLSEMWRREQGTPVEDIREPKQTSTHKYNNIDFILTGTVLYLFISIYVFICVHMCMYVHMH